MEGIVGLGTIVVATALGIGMSLGTLVMILNFAGRRA
jgi:hypothetical protein